LSFCFFDRYDGFKIVTVGNVVEVKGHDLFIEMAAWITAHLKKKVHFFIIGSEWENKTGYVNSLKQRIKKNELTDVHFLGGEVDIPKALSAADLYVCSSKSEASPIAVWEALAMGKPIVSTDVGDIQEICKVYECGLTVNKKSGSLMGEAVLRIIKDNSMKGRIEINARKAAMALLNLDLCAKNHQEVYVAIQSN
jgi:glycosyltransferase involved in cell wall biosynthesis